jgi:hypothetical protein
MENEEIEASSKREPKSITHSKTLPPKKSHRRRSRPSLHKASLSRQESRHIERSPDIDSDDLQKYPFDLTRGMGDNKEASILAFVVAEARIDMKLDQLFETAGFTLGT